MLVDKLFLNANIMNVYMRRFEKKNIAIKNGKIYWLTDENPEAIEVIDLKGKYVIPGFIDAHMHIESSMTTPPAFGAQAALFGTTTVVADAHEIANVAGLKGLKEFMQQPSNIDIFYAIPSSVPSTLPELETTGGIIDESATRELLKDPKIVALGEAMNFKGIVDDSDSLIKQLIAICKELRPTMPLEGHSPKYSGEDLAKFIYSGITSDHTHQTPEGMIEKISNGMFIEIQEKSLTKEIIKTIIDFNLYEHVCFVTDDVMADDLRYSHLNKIIKKAINFGMKPIDAIYLATYTPARRMGFFDRGAIAPGRVADLIILDNLNDLSISQVYKNGEKVIPTHPAAVNFSKELYHSVQADKLNEQDFKIIVEQENGLISTNVIEIEEKSTFTKRIEVMLPVKNHEVVWENSGLALLVVQERYGNNKKSLVYGFVKNAINKPGAIGTTWAHDHHNILLMGTTVKDLVAAQNKLVEQQGGYLVTQQGEVTANTPLPIGGIISNEPIEYLGEQLEKVRNKMIELGYHHFNQIMSLSTLSLLVSPEFKISDRGLFDVKSQKRINLFN